MQDVNVGDNANLNTDQRGSHYTSDIKSDDVTSSHRYFTKRTFIIRIFTSNTGRQGWKYTVSHSNKVVAAKK